MKAKVHKVRPKAMSQPFAVNMGNPNALIVLSSALGGLAVVFPMLAQLPILNQIPVLYLVAFMPAAVAGSFVLVFRRSMEMLPLILLLAVALFGIFWTPIDGVPRGILLFMTLLATFAFGALIRHESDWMLAGTTFVIWSTVALGILLYDYMTSGVRRLGWVIGQDGDRIIEPNQAATQAAFAALVGVILLFQTRGHSGSSHQKVALVICVPILVIGLVLTQSRGGSIAFAAAMAMLLLGGKYKKRVEFLLLIPLFMLLSGMMLLTVGDQLLSRLTAENASTYGGRAEIWIEALKLATSNAQMLLIGAGSGGAGSALGEFSPHLGDFLDVATYSDYVSGTPRINTHNSYLEWLLSFGLVGVSVGVVALAFMFMQAYRLDRGQLAASAHSLLIFFLVTSISLVAYRLVGISIICGALTTGFLFYRRSDIPRTSLGTRPALDSAHRRKQLVPRSGIKNGPVAKRGDL